MDHFITKRQKAGVSARTINLEITVLRNVLNRAIDQELIYALPTENLRPFKRTTAKRELTPAEGIEKLCAVPFHPLFNQGHLTKAGETGTPLLNAFQFADYLRLMCYCGSRLSETLRIRWTDVDWNKRQLTIGADGWTKNGQSRVVDFNVKLEAHCGTCTPAALQAPNASSPPRAGETLTSRLKLSGRACFSPALPPGCRNLAFTIAGIFSSASVSWPASTS